jgi:TonB family protein
MTPLSLRIHSTDAGMRPLTSWAAGLAVTMLGIGVYGACQPLLPANAKVLATMSEDIAAMDFTPADQLQGAEPENAAPEQPQIEMEIPALPEIAQPLTPPEVTELLALDTPPPAPQIKPADAKPKPATTTPRAAANATASAASGSGNAPTLFNGAGTGRFTSPSYPASARSSRQQGSVRILVTVEASGLPSSVEVQTSSGFAALDNAARDHIQRRWRWPEGTVRRFIVPIRFVLQ